MVRRLSGVGCATSICTNRLFKLPRIDEDKTAMMHSEHIRYPLWFRLIVGAIATLLFLFYVMPVIWLMNDGRTLLNTLLPTILVFGALHWVTTVTLGIRIRLEEQTTIHGRQPVLSVRGIGKYERATVLCKDIKSITIVSVDDGFFKSLLTTSSRDLEGHSLFSQPGYKGPVIRIRYETQYGEQGLQFPSRQAERLERRLEEARQHETFRA